MHNRPHQIIRYLSKNNDIVVLSVKDWWKSKQSDLDSYGSDFDGYLQDVDYRYITDLKVSPYMQKLFVRKQLARILNEKFDIHFSYNSMIMGAVVAPHIKTVLDLADDILAMIRSSPQIPYPLRPFGELVGKYYLNREISQAEHVTVTTEVLAETLRLPREKTTVIPNGVDVDFCTQSAQQKIVELDGFILGYVGVLREWVDLASIFKALKQLKSDIKLLVVGHEGRFARTRDLADKYGVGDRVVFTGMVHYSQVPKYIAAMDICLIPFKPCEISHSALPLKLFEYFACEKPVISADLPSVKRAFGNRVLYASTVEGLIKNIEMLYDDSAMRERLGKQGRQLVSNEYNWKKIVNRLENVLTDVAYR
jgi:glycosyltransferase involved in cell wall biosynthesis